MPLGDILQYKSESIEKLYYKLFGIVDLQSHLRWQAIRPYIERKNKNVEIGGSWGLMSFEFVKTTGKPIDCVDIDSKQLNFGIELANKAKISKIRFIEDSLPNLQKLKRDYYEQVLLIDVLEHINEDLESLITINSLLKKNGVLIMSVPTPLFPKYIGYEFANGIGHVRDG